MVSSWGESGFGSILIMFVCVLAFQLPTISGQAGRCVCIPVEACIGYTFAMSFRGTLCAHRAAIGDLFAEIRIKV